MANRYEAGPVGQAAHQANACVQAKKAEIWRDFATRRHGQSSLPQIRRSAVCIGTGGST